MPEKKLPLPGECCWCQPHKGKGKKGKKGQQQGSEAKDGDARKKGASHLCDQVGHFARACTNKKEQQVTCTVLTYIVDQFQWVMMLAEVRQIPEPSSNVELLVESGAACYAWPCKVKTVSSHGGKVVTATGAPVESQVTMEVYLQLVDVHGQDIVVNAVFELLLLRRPTLSESRLVDNGFAVVTCDESGKKIRKSGR